MRLQPKHAILCAHSPVGATLTSSREAGGVFVTTTPSAAPGPVDVTVMVKITGSPTNAVVEGVLIVTATFDSCATGSEGISAQQLLAEAARLVALLRKVKPVGQG